jgi:hypothetical protein
MTIFSKSVFPNNWRCSYIPLSLKLKTKVTAVLCVGGAYKSNPCKATLGPFLFLSSLIRSPPQAPANIPLSFLQTKNEITAVLCAVGTGNRKPCKAMFGQPSLSF